jgi:hypothetical protein
MENLTITEKMEIAKSKLAMLTNKPIKLISTLEMSHIVGRESVKKYYGGATELEAEIVIALNYEMPETNQDTFIHEILHLILKYEGYPEIFINQNVLIKNIPEQYYNIVYTLRDFLKSAIDHPEIFRRMGKDFQIDMSECHKYDVQLKSTRYSEKMDDGKKGIFTIQQDILDGHEYFYFDETNSKFMIKILRDNSPRAYDVCLGLSKQTMKTGFMNPSNARKSAQVILDRIIKFGDKNNSLTPDGFDSNLIWKCFEIK